MYSGGDGRYAVPNMDGAAGMEFHVHPQLYSAYPAGTVSGGINCGRGDSPGLERSVEVHPAFAGVGWDCKIMESNVGY